MTTRRCACSCDCTTTAPPRLAWFTRFGFRIFHRERIGDRQECRHRRCGVRIARAICEVPPHQTRLRNEQRDFCKGGRVVFDGISKDTRHHVAAFGPIDNAHEHVVFFQFQLPGLPRAQHVWKVTGRILFVEQTIQLAARKDAPQIV